MSKNYIGFVNDHSGSMDHLADAATKDYNVQITAVKDAASREMLDTIVSVVGVGVPSGSQVKRQVVISNPHVLKPVTSWPTNGGTPLYDGVGDIIELFESLPDYNNPEVSFLVVVTTDGEESHSNKWSAHGELNRKNLSYKIATLQRTGRWTFVFRVPTGKANSPKLSVLGIPPGNIQEWNTTAEGMAKSTAQTQQAYSTFFSARSAGSKSSTTFYADAAAVDTSALVDVTKDVSLYVVGQHQMGIEIRDFILQHRMEYLKGSAFYQLTKTEARVSHTKLIVIRDRSNGKTYAGNDARKMIGLPTDKNARLHPGDHGNYDIFIQSESVNRKLVAGTGVIYWAAIGKPFTDQDLSFLKPKVAAPVVVQLPAVVPTNKPTPSPVPVAKKVVVPKVNGKPVVLFKNREDARVHARKVGNSVIDLSDYTSYGGGKIDGKRWAVYL